MSCEEHTSKTQIEKETDRDISTDKIRNIFKGETHRCEMFKVNLRESVCEAVRVYRYEYEKERES